ncbi:MAG: rod shape-determining protein RodA [Bacteroidetes bacterium SW_11_45_7]|nr:MAG: rod shape-determining protein RodA [Bacteroidetes bacterium SW_11_45_7]
MRRSRNIAADIDWLTIFLYMIMVAGGIVTVFAATYNTGEVELFNLSSQYSKQLVWAGISIVAAIVIMILDSKFFTTFAYGFYALVALLLIFVLLFGETVSGSRSWFAIGGIRIQPAEFAKFATALALARYVTTRNVNLHKLSSIALSLGIIGLPAALIQLQGDTGSALVFAAFILVMFREGLYAWILMAGVNIAILSVLALVISNWVLITLLLIPAALFIYFGWQTRGAVVVTVFGFILAAGYVYSVDYTFNEILKPHQRERINVLLGKEHDMRGSAYNLNQSLIAIGSGGATGKGFLEGTQTKYDFIPEQSTDFIFCTIGEEFGYVGSVVLISIWLFFLLHIIFISERQRSSFTRVYGYGVASVMFFHVLVNIGMTIGLVPVIGIPLPFISYGGSSLLSFTILVFILLKLDSDRLRVLR